MLTKRIIPCLDVKDGRVVKGTQFRNHRDVGDIIELAQRYTDEGADELVFYDITASSDGRVVDKSWIGKIAKVINIPFCVAGGIRTVEDARKILHDGADKISINSPALERPEFITELSDTFGTQCVVVGIDSREEDPSSPNGSARQDGAYKVYQYTGDETKTIKSKFDTVEWAKTVESLGAGEIVLNCMNNDGMRQGYDLAQLTKVQEQINIPLIASGGAGAMEDFSTAFTQTKISGALAASVFHSGQIAIPDLKAHLKKEQIEVRSA
jgi:cyclase